MSILDELHNMSATIIAKEAQSTAPSRVKYTASRPTDAKAFVTGEDGSTKQVYGAEAHAINAEARRMLGAYLAKGSPLGTSSIGRVASAPKEVSWRSLVGQPVAGQTTGVKKAPSPTRNGVSANKPEVRVNNTIF